LDHQNPADIDDDAIIVVIIVRTQLKMSSLFVVTNGINQQLIVRFTPKFQRCKISDHEDVIRMFHYPNTGDIG
jgi:hypothetical protein